MRRFSSLSTRSTFFTCRFQVLPTMQEIGAQLSARTRSTGSSAAATPFPRVMPNAATFAPPARTSRSMRSKNSSSLGLLPGKPPSITWMPSSASRWAMRIFSSTDTLRPSRCMPSRSVVSYKVSGRGSVSTAARLPAAGDR